LILVFAQLTARKSQWFRSVNCRRFLDFRFGCEKLFTPGLSQALRTFVYGVADTKAVIAGLTFVAGKFSALRARIKRLGLSVAMLLVEHVFANNAHGVLLNRQAETLSQLNQFWRFASPRPRFPK